MSNRQELISFQDIAFDSEIKPKDLDDIKRTLPYLYPKQHDNIVKAETRFETGKGFMLTDGTGAGKAQPLTSKILTPRGWKLMGKIKIGEMVIGSNGKPIEVLGVYPQGRKKIYKVSFSDGSSTECCGNHYWETQTLQERRNLSKSLSLNISSKKWLPKIRTTKELIKTVNKRHFIPIVKPIEYPKRKFKINPYLLGIILGDGSITGSQITITSIDGEIIDKISSFIPKGSEMYQMPKKDRCPAYSIRAVNHIITRYGGINNNPMFHFLNQMGLMGTNSSTKFIPKEYLFCSVEQKLELIRGLMDSDGTVDKRSGSAIYTTISKKLRNGVVELVNSLGGVATVSEKTPTYWYGGKKREGKLAYNITLNLPEGMNPFWVFRKSMLYRFNYKYLPKRVITSIEYVGLKKAQCISVDSPRSLYVTDNHILTHNTLSGLGIIKRFVLQGKDKILIVVPTDQKCKDWILEGRHLQLDIRQLRDTTDRGYGVSVTTYANMYQNMAITGTLYDLIVYDECHYLIQNQKGEATSCMAQHKIIANLPSAARGKATEAMHPVPDYEASYEWQQMKEKWQAKHTKLSEEYIDHTKVLFLSATPFAYHKTIKYVDGCLFEIEEFREEQVATFAGYGIATGFEKFLCDNFGYSIRYNKCTKPDHEIDLNILEREFFENAKKKGLVSTQVLELDSDYSREFIKIDSSLGQDIDNGMAVFYKEGFEDKYPTLHKLHERKYKYLYINQLLECIKASLVKERIEKHLYIGRQVVLFHSYNNARLTHPFKFVPENMLLTDEEYLKHKLEEEIREFEIEYAYLLDLDISNLKDVRTTIKEMFPDANEFNGTVSKKLRSVHIENFQDPYHGDNIMIIQTKAGREGISLHDKYGGAERVIINLGLPVAPTEAIQQEGRIYRSGMVGNAIYEYICLQTSFERSAFANKIATRARTAENLAMGNLARDLEHAFKDGYANANNNLPSIMQGRGSKRTDRVTNNMTTWDKAKAYYWKRQKKTKYTAFSGVDYYGTPEPLGLKMVEWLNCDPGAAYLEPSAGHGAISRWFPSVTENVMIEPSYTLASETKLVSTGNVQNIKFEDYYIGNKFEGIVMNPPFGVGGKTAVEHLTKALGHIRYKKDSYIYCIVPTGGMCQKRLETMYESRSFLHYRLAGELLLPECTFKRAGTTAKCKILKLVKNCTDDNVYDKIDLSHCKDINELFDELETLIF